MSETAELSHIAAVPGRFSWLSALTSRVVGLSAVRVEWGVIFGRALVAGGMVLFALTNDRTENIAPAAIGAGSISLVYSPLLAYLVHRGHVSFEILLSVVLDTLTVLAGVTWAAWLIAERVAENAAALSPDQLHQTEHDIYRPMLALVMFVALRLKPFWGGGFVVSVCLVSLWLTLSFAGGAFSGSSLAFQYLSLAITGLAAVVVSGFIQQMRSELEEALDDRSELIQVVTHEVGNPLAALKASLEMTRDEYSDKLDDDFKRLIRVANNSVNRIEALARNLSALRSVDARVEPPVLSPVVLEAVIQFAVDSMQPLATEREVTIEVQADDEERHLALANHDAVDRILVNLISNAIKYCSAGSAVHVRFGNAGDRVLINVEDDGPGIPDDEKPMLFRRYFRASNAYERKVPGSGLGLFICRELALRMGGDVSVADRPSGGSIFTLSLRRQDASNA